jgi:hypothetical protein
MTCNQLKVNGRFGGSTQLCLLPVLPALLLGLYLTLKMGAIFSFETSVHFQLTTGSSVPEDRALLFFFNSVKVNLNL